MMRSVDRHYWMKAVGVSALAFALGVAAYILFGVLLTRGETGATAAHQQIVVQSSACDCVVKFVPEQPMEGYGSTADPYVTYNSHVSLVVGVSGSGYITIEDGAGNVLAAYMKPSAGYEESVVSIDLLNGLGIYALTVKLDGVAAVVGTGVYNPLYIDYRALPLGPPNTGAPHFYVAGYAVQTFGGLISGGAFAVIAFGTYVLLAAKKRKKNEAVARQNAVLGKAIKREFSSREISKSGVVNTQKRQVKPGRKKQS